MYLWNSRLFSVGGRVICGVSDDGAASSLLSVVGMLVVHVCSYNQSLDTVMCFSQGSFSEKEKENALSIKCAQSLGPKLSRIRLQRRVDVTENIRSLKLFRLFL